MEGLTYLPLASQWYVKLGSPHINLLSCNVTVSCFCQAFWKAPVCCLIPALQHSKRHNSVNGTAGQPKRCLRILAALLWAKLQVNEGNGSAEQQRYVFT